MKHVIGALLWKMPRVPLPFNPALCGWDGERPWLTVWNLLNYTRIDNAQKVDKNTFVFHFHHLDFIRTTTGGTEQIRACVSIMINPPDCQLITKLEMMHIGTGVRLY